MILTLTPNPSTDSTLQLTTPIAVGGVSRAETVTRVAGGKGVNVSHAAHQAGRPTMAVFPSAPSDPFIALAEDTSLPYRAVSIDAQVRTNITITDPTGQTTKINGPGPLLTPTQVTALVDTVRELAPTASAIVLAGSLPPGVDTSFYSRAITALRDAAPNTLIAVDTSDKPMRDLGANFATAAPTVIKPNGLELGQLIGVDGLHLEEQAAAGNFTPVVSAAQQAVEQGVAEVLVTLGAAGAVLVTANGAWKATPPPITVRSTVGAGDCSLAGYLLERTAGGSPAECLRTAVAYGTAAAGLPGTTIPTPAQVNLDDTVVSSFDGKDR